MHTVLQLLWLHPNSNPNVNMIHSLINTKHKKCGVFFSLRIHPLFFPQVTVSNDIVGGLYCIEFSFLYCRTTDSIYEGLEDEV